MDKEQLKRRLDEVREPMIADLIANLPTSMAAYPLEVEPYVEQMYDNFTRFLLDGDEAAYRAGRVGSIEAGYSAGISNRVIFDASERFYVRLGEAIPEAHDLINQRMTFSEHLLLEEAKQN